MNYIIPMSKTMSDKKLAHHFSKSDIFCVYNEEHKNIAVFKNPLLEAKGCSGKGLLIDAFNKYQCEVVIVRKIGEKTLARLLNAGFSVEQGNTRHSVEELLSAASTRKKPLTQPSQGVIKKTPCSGH
jgi:predicted Fe-Mo cluster-binding NifX family protein